MSNTRELFRLDHKEAMMIQLFRTLSADAQKALLLQAGIHTDNQTDNADNVVPLVRIQAG